MDSLSNVSDMLRVPFLGVLAARLPVSILYVDRPNAILESLYLRLQPKHLSSTANVQLRTAIDQIGPFPLFGGKGFLTSTKPRRIPWT